MDVREATSFFLLFLLSLRSPKNNKVAFKRLLICLDRLATMALLWAKCLSLNAELFLSSGDFSSFVMGTIVTADCNLIDFEVDSEKRKLDKLEILNRRLPLIGPDG